MVVFNGEFYKQRLQKQIFLYLSTRLFRGVFTPLIRTDDERSENFTKQPVDKYRKISFCDLSVYDKYLHIDFVVHSRSRKPFSINTYTAKPVCWNGWISDSYCSLTPLCSGMGEVVPARTSPTLLPPSPRTVLSLSCFKVSQCINCRDWHCKS